MTQRALGFLITLSLLTLSACSGNDNLGVGPIGAPVGNAMIPSTSMTVITALLKGQPVPGITVAAWKAELPCLTCQPRLLKKLASGKTGPKGRVSLSGDWTDSTFLCAEGAFARGAHKYQAQVCSKPFPKAEKLEF